MSKKRWSASAQNAVERVNAGGEWDEWFDLGTSIEVGQVLGLDESLDKLQRATAMMGFLVKDWSLTDEAGNKLPITPEAISKLPLDMTMPVLEAINTRFLKRG